MSVLARILLLLVVVPLLELALLIQVGRWMGVWPTVGLVFLTGVVGAILAKAEGVRTLWSFRLDLARGRVPTQPIQDGVSILVGGALLLTPGLLTDVAGFALLLPPTRRRVQKAVRRRLMRMIQDGTVRVVTDSPIFGARWGGAPEAGDEGPGDAGLGEEGGRIGRNDPRDVDEGRRRPELDPDKEIRG